MWRRVRGCRLGADSPGNDLLFEVQMETPEFERESHVDENHRPHDSTTPRLVTVALDQIDFADTTFQFRFATRGGNLLGSLKAEGQREPIDLRGKPPYQIVDGFRRVQCARKLGWDTITAFVHEDLDDKEAHRVAFVKNVVRRNLTGLERANALVLAQKRGFLKADLAQLFGVSERQVERDLAVARYPEPILRIVDGREVTLKHAKVLAEFAVKNPAKWERRIKAEQLSAARLRKILLEDRGRQEAGRKKQYVRKDRVGWSCRASR